MRYSLPCLLLAQVAQGAWPLGHQNAKRDDCPTDPVTQVITVVTTIYPSTPLATSPGSSIMDPGNGGPIAPVTITETITEPAAPSTITITSTETQTYSFINTITQFVTPSMTATPLYSNSTSSYTNTTVQQTTSLSNSTSVTSSYNSSSFTSSIEFTADTTSTISPSATFSSSSTGPVLLSSIGPFSQSSSTFGSSSTPGDDSPSATSIYTSPPPTSLSSVEEDGTTSESTSPASTTTIVITTATSTPLLISTTTAALTADVTAIPCTGPPFNALGGGCSSNCYCDSSVDSTTVGFCDAASTCGPLCQSDTDCPSGFACSSGHAECGGSVCLDYTGCAASPAKMMFAIRGDHYWRESHNRPVEVVKGRDIQLLRNTNDVTAGTGNSTSS